MVKELSDYYGESGKDIDNHHIQLYSQVYGGGASKPNLEIGGAYLRNMMLKFILKKYVLIMGKKT